MIGLVTIARAGTALDGSSGLWTVPTADTAPPGKLRASASLELVRDFDGFEARGLPVGFGAGLFDRVEVGGSVDRSPAIGWEPLTPVGTGVYARARALDPAPLRPAFALEVAARGLGRSAVGELTAIVALGTGIIAALVPALVTARRDFGPLLGAARATMSRSRLLLQRALI
ncbi:MAG: hypothetical protein ABMA64_40485, partial [Myxococcota bacterium]